MASFRSRVRYTGFFLTAPNEDWMCIPPTVPSSAVVASIGIMRTSSPLRPTFCTISASGEVLVVVDSAGFFPLLLSSDGVHLRRHPRMVRPRVPVRKLPEQPPLRASHLSPPPSIPNASQVGCHRVGGIGYGRGLLHIVSSRSKDTTRITDLVVGAAEVALLFVVDAGKVSTLWYDTINLHTSMVPA